MAKVVLSTALPDSARKLLDGHEVQSPERGMLDRPALLAALAGADAAITLLTDRVDEEFLAAGPKLKIVANVAVGYDNIDVDAATRRGIVVTNTPGVLTDATADLAFALLLGAARHVADGDAMIRAGRWTGWDPGQLLGSAVFGRTLGIVGLGRIGRAVAARAKGFGMSILYSGPRRAPAHFEWALEAIWLPLAEMLPRADFVSIHCPLGDATRHLIGARELSLMKPGAILVNTARGPIVDEEALVAALESGHLGGAGLDVFENEPNVRPSLRKAPRTLLLPHVGSATVAARTAMGELAAGSVADLLAGRRPKHVVNSEVIA
jgi:glyoxylate reductase